MPLFSANLARLTAKTILAAGIAFSISAGSNTKAPLIGSSPTPGSVSLSKDQIGAVHAGVRRMVPNPDSASFSSDIGRMAKQGSGIDVCGHVRYLDTDGQTKVEQPYYVELRETNGQPNAERGQVGGDPSKLAKVRFLCRDHK